MSPATRLHIIVVIPARYASQRLPGKPLADIGGLPMVVRVAEQARRAKTVDEVYIATDDERIQQVVDAAGFRALMTSPACPSGTDRIAEAVRTLGEVDIIVNVQGDEPLLPPAMIDQAVQPLIDDPSISVGTLVKVIRSEEELHNPAVTKVVLDARRDCLYFSRSPIPYLRDGGEQWLGAGLWYRHIGLYVYRREFLFHYSALSQTPLERAEKLEQLRVLEHGFRIHAEVTELESVAVDTQDDLDRVRTMVAMR